MAGSSASLFDSCKARHRCSHFCGAIRFPMGRPRMSGRCSTSIALRTGRPAGPRAHGGRAKNGGFIVPFTRCAVPKESSCAAMISDRLSLPAVSASITETLDVMRVLVVEDDKKIASFVVNGLKQSGFAVDHSANGEDGLIMARSVAYDAAVIDVMLPKLDGLSLVQALR